MAGAWLPDWVRAAADLLRDTSRLVLRTGCGPDDMDRIPTSWQDLQQMWNTLWPIMSENLLGVSTRSSQDIMYYAPLLLVAEAALLVLGVALLLWRWRHPAAFLLLLSGFGVLLVGVRLCCIPIARRRCWPTGRQLFHSSTWQLRFPLVRG